MTELLSLALFERGSRSLVVKRKDGHAPFAGAWLLPTAVVGSEESAEEALERHTYRELGVEAGGLEFAETLYLEDNEDNIALSTRYVANIFRVLDHEGELRFRADGDYDDARWLTGDELAGVGLAPALLEWLQTGRHQAPAVAPVPAPSGGATPDNRRGWNAISRAYQEQYEIPTDRLVYAPRCPDESELQLLGDVAGLRVIVVGCGGGQDCIVLAKQGARVIGIDLSDKQIEYGRRLAEREGVDVTLQQGNVEQLVGIEDESQDLAVSLHALNYVERVDRAFAEAYRVLRGGSPFVFSVQHPFFAATEGGAPYSVVHPYWSRKQDWQWDFPEKGVSARLRSWYRTVGEWCSLLLDAGFRIERLLEPPPVEGGGASPWDGGYAIEKMRLIPATLIVKAVKP